MTSDIGSAVLITGAARGIGRAIAAALLDRYSRILLTDRDVEAGRETATALGPTVAFEPLDVTQASDVTRLFDAARERYGAIQALVNNAGIYPHTEFLGLAEAEWDRVVDTNLKGCFLCSQAFATHRVSQGGGGAIVNVASTAAFSARPGAAPYSASKAGIVMLTRSLAQELGSARIRVNAVAPGLILLPEGGGDPAYRERFVSMVPSGRVGLPEDVAKVVRFLLSEEAEYVNGACIPVDGGFLAGRALPESQPAP